MPVSARGMASGLVDELIRSRRRTVAIIVHRDGRVVVRAPLRASLRDIQAFVDSKRAWIVEKKAQLATRVAALPTVSFEPGAQFLLLGQSLPLRLEPDPRARLSRDEAGLCLTTGALPKARALFEKWYRAQAAAYIPGRAAELAARHGFRFTRVRISSARTRWGSCSSSGTLSFTWRLVMAPPEVVDYVIVHELAHIKVHNHSPAFWAEVEKLMPGCKRQREWLRKNGKHLTLGGDE